MQKNLFLALFFVCFFHPLAAQNHTYDLPIQEHLFENGLRLLVLERPGDHRVACKIFTDMGALNETPGDLGAAHFLEHLMFKGTETLGTTDWQQEKPIIEKIYATQKALIEALNRARNEIRERGVFHDYRHTDSTPAIDSLRNELARLDREAAKYRKNGEMMRWYQGFGGSRLTASTEQEYMKFDINLPANRVELFLRVEADRMRNSVFREFDQERMILVEQRYGDLNRPTTPYYEAMNALVSSVHPVFWPEGYLSDFDRYSRHYQRDLYRRYFVPNNTTLIFIGGVTLEELIPQVEHYFGWMQRAQEPMRVKAIEPVPQAEKRLIWRSMTLSPRVEMRFMIPAIGHPDRPHFDVLSEVFAERMQETLQLLRINGSVNVNTRVVHTSRFGVPATMNFEVVLASENDLAVCEQVMLDVVDRMKSEKITSDKLQMAKKRLRTDWYRTALSADRLAFEIGHFQIMDHWGTLKKHLEARETTTAEDLQRLAKRYFIPENRSVGIVRKPGNASDGKEVGR
jgi:predicted Zn-dependent peptidase